MNGLSPNAPTALSRPMVDPFGRTISYLRVSVTDRCDLRCFYCMSEDMTFLPKADLLTLEELDRLCSAFIVKGVRKLRLTGGEPLVRRNVMSLVRSLSRHLDTGALKELTLTTNGSQLARFAGELRDCGVRRINVSMDTLDPAKFRAITRWGDLDKVLGGIEAARSAGLAVKINAVALKNLNEDEIPALVHHFVRQSAAEFDRGDVRLSEETMQHLLLYRWPGNVRQLQNEIRRMVALAEPHAVLSPDQLSDEVFNARLAPDVAQDTFEIVVRLKDKLQPAIARLEREMIRVALHDHAGNLDEAARALGVSRKGLYLKRQRLAL